jgi:lipopolysaccharide export system protein LptA
MCISNLLILVLLVSGIAQAEIASDKTAKLYITSQTAELNKATGISVFIGDVKVDHGSTHVTADKLTTYSDENNRMTKAIALGNTSKMATYESITDTNKPPLFATAEKIEYFPQKKYVILIGNAHVTQGKNSIAGPQLEYDLEKQLLITKTDQAKAHARTEIIIQPNEVGTSKQ